MENMITLTLKKALIIESVKNETFQRGKFDKAIDPKAISAAYVEQAGNEQYHERILERTLFTSLEELKTHLSDYLLRSGGSVSSTEDYDDISINLSVDNRFNRAYKDSLARLCSKYIEESMLMDWWRPINEKQSQLYSLFVERDLAAIQRCFNKTAPVLPTYKYPKVIHIFGSTVRIDVGEEYTITYSTSECAIDDVEIKIADTRICEAGKADGGFSIIGKKAGNTTALLYSRHNEEVNNTIQIFVREQL